MFATDTFEEVTKHPIPAKNINPQTEQPASVDAQFSDHSSSAHRMHWTARESEIMAAVWSEMDKPRLTKSVRDALEAGGDEAVEALERYSRIA
ncbi:MAG: hypothetical protein ABSD72_09410 [Terracidiphilus sp.]|jgi:hypothetical protein